MVPLLPSGQNKSISAPFIWTNISTVCVRTVQRCLNFLSSPRPSSSLFFSLGVFRRVFAVSCLGPGPLCQSLFTHQTRTPADDPGCHSLPTGVEGGHVLPFTVFTATHVLCVMRSMFPCLPLTCCQLMPCLVLLTLVFSLVPGQYVRISFWCSHALHTYLQTMGPGSYWYVWMPRPHLIFLTSLSGFPSKLFIIDNRVLM